MAVTLSRMLGVEVQSVAEALEVHPLMRSGWRNDMRDGALRG
jgi:hypothetical protein